MLPESPLVTAAAPVWAQSACWLFVPGDRAERFERAAASNADTVVLDLEASVLPARKAQARADGAAWLASAGTGPSARLVRVNPISSPWFDDDARALRALPQGACIGVMLAMTASPNDVARARNALPGLPLVALIESAEGVLQAADIARSGIARIAFGNMDYQTDIDSTDAQALVYPSSVLVAASRAAGLPPPMAGVTAAFRDEAQLRRDIAFERGLGFGGKLCIHPGQVAAISAAFTPTPQQIAWARRVLAVAADSHAVELDGELIDRPVVDRARRLLARVNLPPA
jgi:citrate lyase subunit beta/citryl-CoA lyase